MFHRRFVFAAAAVSLVLGSGAASGQTLDESSIARWVRKGTFALSGFGSNPERHKKSYLGADAENRRLLSFLPSMTIFFPDETLAPAALLPDYLSGRTQTGMPVVIPASTISKGSFGDSPSHEVVVHHSHRACSEKYCNPDNAGESGLGAFQIASEDAEIIHLVNSFEADLFYKKARFDTLERRGVLTKIKGKKIPRWDIFEGYASRLSLGCNGRHPAGSAFEVNAADYESSPETWDINAHQWDVVAIDLFVGGAVENEDGTYRAELAFDVHDTTKPEDAGEDYQSAIDVTVFAYRDRNEPEEDFQYAVLIANVACNKIKGPFGGAFTLGHVRNAWLYFEGENRRLPDQMTETGKRAMAAKLDRTLLYSVNSPRQYQDLFDVMSHSLDVAVSDIRANLVSVLLARLNASCKRTERDLCARIVAGNASAAP